MLSSTSNRLDNEAFTRRNDWPPGLYISEHGNIYLVDGNAGFRVSNDNMARQYIISGMKLQPYYGSVTITNTKD